MALVTFYDTTPPYGYPGEIPADALPCKGSKSLIMASWPQSEPNCVAISDCLFEQTPDLIDTLPWSVVRIDCLADPMRPGVTYWRRVDRCDTCKQSDIGQTGEYPCAGCGLPREWDAEVRPNT